MNLGCKVFIITSKFKKLPFVEKIENITIYRLPVFRKKKYSSTIFQMLLYLIFAFPLMIFILLKEKIRNIHVHFIMPTGILGLIAKKLLNVRYIVTLHGGDVPSHQKEDTGSYYKYLMPLAKLVIKHSEKCITVSNPLLKLALKDFPDFNEKFECVENGVSVNKNIIIKNLSFPLQLIFVGRLSPEKQIFKLVKMLHDFKIDYYLRIVGDGEERISIENYLNDNGEQRVKILGWLNKSEIEKYLSISHFSIMNSKFEGLSISALESLNYGVPIISSRCEGMVKIIEPTVNGFLFENKEELSIVLESITKMDFQDVYEKMQLDCFSLLKRRYNIAKSAELYLEYFK